MELDPILTKSSILDAIKFIGYKAKDSKFSEIYFKSIEPELQQLSEFWDLPRQDTFVFAMLLYSYKYEMRFPDYLCKHVGLHRLDTLRFAENITNLAMRSFIRGLENAVDYYYRQQDELIFLNKEFILNDDVITSIAVNKPFSLSFNLRSCIEFIGLLSINQFKLLEEIINKNIKEIKIDVDLEQYNSNEKYLIYRCLYEKLFNKRFNLDITIKSGLIDVSKLLQDSVIKDGGITIELTEEFLSRIGMD